MTYAVAGPSASEAALRSLMYTVLIGINLFNGVI